jgi:site-specific recombinase XerD
MIKSYGLKTKITKKIHPNLFRHCAISFMSLNGMTDAEVKRISGHSKKSTALQGYKGSFKDEVIDKTF